MLFLREDNLKAAITAINNGGWDIKTGDSTYKYIFDNTDFDLKSFFESIK